MKHKPYFKDYPSVSISKYEPRACQKQMENYCNQILQNYIRVFNEQFNVIWNYQKSEKCWEASRKHRINLVQLNPDETL